MYSFSLEPNKNVFDELFSMSSKLIKKLKKKKHYKHLLHKHHDNYGVNESILSLTRLKLGFKLVKTRIV
ncbi:hypothetical protein HanRHA438_Chr12g0546471 [Helianthus annuus]|nr:hypothetical protein HanRHA438_Chr12g0546471 [Helianthus annuus]